MEFFFVITDSIGRRGSRVHNVSQRRKYLVYKRTITRLSFNLFVTLSVCNRTREMYTPVRVTDCTKGLRSALRSLVVGNS